MGRAGSGALIDWQVFAYTVRDKMSRPALVVTCVGCWQNKLMRVIYHAARALLSRGLGGRGLDPLLLATPVTCHATAGTGRGVDGRGERGEGEEDGDVERERGETEEDGAVGDIYYFICLLIFFAQYTNITNNVECRKRHETH